MPKETINNKPLHSKIHEYAEEAKKGLLDRREFLAYATALGATTATAGWSSSAGLPVPSLNPVMSSESP